jgi:hypothetical protein
MAAIGTPQNDRSICNPIYTKKSLNVTHDKRWQMSKAIDIIKFQSNLILCNNCTQPLLKHKHAVVK